MPKLRRLRFNLWDPETGTMEKVHTLELKGDGRQFANGKEVKEDGPTLLQDSEMNDTKKNPLYQGDYVELILPKEMIPAKTNGLLNLNRKDEKGIFEVTIQNGCFFFASVTQKSGFTMQNAVNHNMTCTRLGNKFQNPEILQEDGEEKS